ncbi:hypothetical protein PV10_01646 [Exophiala mesophila]|uniref:Zn(2)-C6 fungal-type domain-containing protein n=1 Tax=Exophiala mesophila TaxID=212818 RepID=A0A0D1YBG2_EXOME|nr:uncharacterized protein PV10_01646 [Exophiala mesophila]KIV97951.1 hypothetical protein PV10_01646 [Exophiala mesophila]
MAEPERRRARPPVSCSLCRKRKIKCDREVPCGNCVRSKSKSCSYEALQAYAAYTNSRKQASQSRPNHAIPHLNSISAINQSSDKSHGLLNDASSSDVSDVATQGTSQSNDTTNTPLSSATSPTSHEIETMRTKIRYLEDQLSKDRSEGIDRNAFPTPMYSVETITTELAGAFTAEFPGLSSSQSKAASNSVFHKGRLFGQSHWINGVAVFGDIFDLIEPVLRDPTSKMKVGMQRCKYLGRLIKMQREPSWPVQPTLDLPPRHVADKLVECYLRTIETLYRIVHIPSFKQEYESLWESNSNVDLAIVVQVKLALAIGAATYDDQFSMRSSAIRWVYEAQTWCSSPEFKSRLNLRSLQNQCLLLIAREMVNVGAGLVWIAAGELLRSAIYMGLHRDPTWFPRATPLKIEMSRRLWNTILEICVQSSIQSGAPPLLSMEQFDCQPPRNFDDDQLMTDDPVPKPESVLTQSSVAIALRSTLPSRLRVVHFLNDLGSTKSYQDALRLDNQLRTAYRVMCRTLRSLTPDSGGATLKFAINAVEVLIRHYLSTLHVPFLGTSNDDTAYAYSRKVVIDNSLKIWCTVYPSTTLVQDGLGSPQRMERDADDFARLSICGLGFFRSVAFQSTMLIALELRAQSHDEYGLGPSPLRPDLLSALDESIAWAMRCIEAGEVNVKGYFFTSVVSCLIRMRDASQEELLKTVVKTAEDLIDECLPILERQAGIDESMEQGAGQDKDTGQGPKSLSVDMFDDWDLMMTDAQFTFESTGPMSWMVENEGSGEMMPW